MNYRSNGKLLLTGEYAVLQGAQALALPVKFGQALISEKSVDHTIVWEAYENEKLWFQAEFSLSGFEIKKTNNHERAVFIKKMLDAIKIFKPEIFDSGYILQHYLDFDRNWGLGTSSTLVSNMAQWAGINPFDLHFSISNGSGYDVACAVTRKPIIYQIVENQPRYEEVSFFPSFHDKLYFAYLGKKVATEQNLSSFLQNGKLSKKEIDKISALTREIHRCNKFVDINILIYEHEQLLSNVLNVESVRNTVFYDFPGTVKSLGAWGGDFVMIVHEGEREKLEKYLHSKNIFTFFRFDEIVLS